MMNQRMQQNLRAFLYLPHDAILVTKKCIVFVHLAPMSASPGEYKCATCVELAIACWERIETTLILILRFMNQMLWRVIVCAMEQALI